jgi:hypothetical protein
MILDLFFLYCTDLTVSILGQVNSKIDSAPGGTNDSALAANSHPLDGPEQYLLY